MFVPMPPTNKIILPEDRLKRETRNFINTINQPNNVVDIVKRAHPGENPDHYIKDLVKNHQLTPHDLAGLQFDINRIKNDYSRVCRIHMPRVGQCIADLNQFNRDLPALRNHMQQLGDQQNFLADEMDNFRIADNAFDQRLTDLHNALAGIVLRLDGELDQLKANQTNNYMLIKNCETKIDNLQKLVDMILRSYQGNVDIDVDDDPEFVETKYKVHDGFQEIAGFELPVEARNNTRVWRQVRYPNNNTLELKQDCFIDFYHLTRNNNP